MPDGMPVIGYLRFQAFQRRDDIGDVDLRSAGGERRGLVGGGPRSGGTSAETISDEVVDDPRKRPPLPSGEVLQARSDIVVEIDAGSH
jgi:hypothetical protein